MSGGVPEKEHGFRMSMGIGKDAGTVEHLFITLGSENAGFKEVWNATIGGKSPYLQVVYT